MSRHAFVADAFVNNFMTGFSFVDAIDANKRAERRLEERLAQQQEDRSFQRRRLLQGDKQSREDRIADEEDRAFERSRTLTRDAQISEDRAFTKLTREEKRAQTQRQRQATLIMSDPNAPIEELRKFADFPEVAAKIAERVDQADLEQMIGFGGQQVPTDVLPQEAAPQPEDVPVAEAAGPTLSQIPNLSPEELNDLADVDVDAAQEQKRLQQGQRPVSPEEIGLSRARREKLPPTSERERENIRRREAKKGVEAQWTAFNDINDESGESLRNLDPSIQVAKYFDDRGNLNENTQLQADLRMRPSINKAVLEQSMRLRVAAPGSIDLRNAKRKLSEAYSLANEIGVTFNPLKAAGVDARGLPIGGNKKLTDSVIAEGQTGPGTSLPMNPDMQRADGTVLDRPASGNRITDRQATAAYRRLKSGRIDFKTYEFYMKNGHMPSGAKTTISQTDPKKDTWAVYTLPDGSVQRQIIERARNPDKASARNVVGDDALRYLNTIASSLDTDDDPIRGSMMLTRFLAALGENEQAAITAGYDYQNINDVSLLYQRYNDLFVVRNAYNDEVFGNGQVFPDFTQDYGSISQALFDRDLDKLDRQSIADFFGSAAPLQELKPRRLEEIAAVRAQAPGFGDKTDEEIDAALTDQGL